MYDTLQSASDFQTQVYYKEDTEVWLIQSLPNKNKYLSILHYWPIYPIHYQYATVTKDFPSTIRTC